MSMGDRRDQQHLIAAYSILGLLDLLTYAFAFVFVGAVSSA